MKWDREANRVMKQKIQNTRRRRKPANVAKSYWKPARTVTLEKLLLLLMVMMILILWR